uniref:Uncharacterized protein n=1 Tax=viral metagenome TaxID=1070528 RepID=A0A6C0EBH5_9ZZZZ
MNDIIENKFVGFYILNTIEEAKDKHKTKITFVSSCFSCDEGILLLCNDEFKSKFIDTLNEEEKNVFITMEKTHFFEFYLCTCDKFEKCLSDLKIEYTVKYIGSVLCCISSNSQIQYSLKVH